MSNAIIFDSLLVRELARALDDQLAGRRLIRASFEVRESSLVLVTRGDAEGERRGSEVSRGDAEGERRGSEVSRGGAETRRGSEVSRGGAETRRGSEVSRGGAETRRWGLQLTQGWIRREGWSELRMAGDLPVGANAVITGVTAPADERILVFGVGRAGRLGDGSLGEDGRDAATGAGDEGRAGSRGQGATHRVARIIVSLITNRWNAVAVGTEGIVLATLRSLRGRNAARPGQPYVAPEPTRRLGAQEPVDPGVWRDVLGHVPPAEREAALIRTIAYTSGLNAAAVLGDAARVIDGDVLAAAYTRYIDVVAARRASPCLIDGRQPYPVRLPGVAAERYATLLDAFEAAAARLGVPAGAAERPRGRKELRRERALDATRRALERARRKRDRLEAERRGARPEADRLRKLGDLLLSQLHRVGRGDRSVTLDDWEGGQVEVQLDPSATAAENASRLYARARKRERAATTLPALIERAAADVERLASLTDRIEAGDAEAIREAADRFRRRSVARRTSAPPALPFRTYHTSGGFEVRVGRGSRANDELTFRYSAPDDIWLHAREVGGAHVVLRWGDKLSNPPARDLNEAAVLAALHSKARTSGTVPVDWTRRKYVRKPRKAKPGLVVIDRAKTVFVSPDPGVEKRMRA